MVDPIRRLAWRNISIFLYLLLPLFLYPLFVLFLESSLSVSEFHLSKYFGKTEIPSFERPMISISIAFVMWHVIGYEALFYDTWRIRRQIPAMLCAIVAYNVGIYFIMTIVPAVTSTRLETCQYLKGPSSCLSHFELGLCISLSIALAILISERFVRRKGS